MKPDVNAHDLHARKALMAVALCSSVLVLLLLHFEGISAGAIIMTVITYLLWLLAARASLRGVSAIADAPVHDSNPLRSVPAQVEHNLDHYYARLLANLEFGWARFQHDHDHALHALHNVERSLGRAIDIAESTGLLASNALMSAAHCGEVGRGFVSVSRDLIGISEQSREDLGRLRRMVRSFVTELSYCRLLVEHPLEFWMVSSAGLPMTELVKLRTEVERFQRELNLIGDRYRRAQQADVRWLQLGDAIRRLLSELINTLYQLELHLQDVLSDMRLLQLSHGKARQIVEIKDRMPGQTAAGEPLQKFMF